MDAAFVMGLVKQHFGSILVFFLVAIAWWRGGFEKISNAVDKVEAWYESARSQLERHKVRQVAGTVYAWVNDQARTMAKKTETTKDDFVVDKLAMGLKKGIAILDRLGLGGDGAKDELEALFGEFHEAERKAEVLAASSPFAKEKEGAPS